MIDATVFEWGYRKYAQALVYRASILTRSHDAEDVAQDAWVEAWKARDILDKAGLWSWLKAVLKRVWWHRLNRYGSRGKRAGIKVPVDEAINVAVAANQEAIVERSQIERAADTMTAGRRDAIRLTMTGHHTGEIAELRGTSVQAASEALRSAVVILRKKWRLA